MQRLFPRAQYDGANIKMSRPLHDVLDNLNTIAQDAIGVRVNPSPERELPPNGGSPMKPLRTCGSPIAVEARGTKDMHASILTVRVWLILMLVSTQLLTLSTKFPELRLSSIYRRATSHQSNLFPRTANDKAAATQRGKGDIVKPRSLQTKLWTNQVVRGILRRIISGIPLGHTTPCMIG